MGSSEIADVSTAVESVDGVDRPDIVSALTIVSHPVGHRAGEQCLLEVLAAGKEVLLTRNAPDFHRPGRAIDMPLDDPYVSRKAIRLASQPGGDVRLTVDPRGTPVFAGSLIEKAATFSTTELNHGVPIELGDRVVLLLHLVDRTIPAAVDTHGMVGISAGIGRVRGDIERLDGLTVPVLIRGETGTGKELVARAIHDRSPRRSGPFVSVNLGSLTRELVAADLFGAQRGAFTGARERDGLFRAAHGGTLFLDEVGEAAPEVQVALFRVLETGEILPVGGDRPVSVDVRLIAATDADLEDKIRKGQFKAPLLHRLAQFDVRLPPLRERRDDIGLLFYHFAREQLEAIGEAHRLSPRDPYAKPWLPAHIAAQLVRYGWDGNIRELRNIAQRLVIGSRGLPQLRVEPQLAEQLGITKRPSSDAIPIRPPSDPLIELRRPPPEPAEPRRKPSEVTEAELREALRASVWDRAATADRLRIPRPSIYDLIARYPDIRTAGDLSADEIARCFQVCAGDVDAMVQRLEVSKAALIPRLRDLGLIARRTHRPSSDPGAPEE